MRLSVTKTHTDTKAQDEVSGNHQIAVQSPERKANGSGVRAHHLRKHCGTEAAKDALGQQAQTDGRFHLGIHFESLMFEISIPRFGPGNPYPTNSSSRQSSQITRGRCLAEVGSHVVSRTDSEG
jgi:hypothetical protein